jgi:hypothetical protein
MILFLAFVIGFSFRQASSSGGGAARTAPAAPASAGPTTPALGTATAPGAAAGEDPAPAAQPATVTINIDTSPSGAKIEGQDGVAVGVSPVALILPRSNVPVPFTVNKPGYVSSRYMITPDRDLDALLTLQSAPATPPAIPDEMPAVSGQPQVAARPRPTAPVRARRAKAAAPHVSDGKVREGLSIDPFAEEPEPKNP